MFSALRSSVILIAAFSFGLAAAASKATATDNARYMVTVEVNWSEERYPTAYPKNAHWSRLLATTHNKRFSLFRDGDTASSGLALLATNGRVGVLEAELAEARRRRRVGAYVVVEGASTGVSAFVFEIDVGSQTPLISLATMVAPSPDWFAAAGEVALRDGAEWIDVVEAPLWAWDAGADSGDTFEAPNHETQPRQSVRFLFHRAFLTANAIEPIGAVSFRRLE